MSMSRKKTSHPLYGNPLTEREKEIIRLAGSGYSNIEIGEALFLSSNTVKSHLRRAGLKTGTGNRTSLVLWLLAEDVLTEAYDLESTLYQFRRYGWDS